MSLFLSRLILLSLWLSLAACSHITDFSRVGDNAADQRRLLVTFVDQTIGRTVSGNALDNYPTGGQYQNSGWSGRVARALAERHHLQVVAQWPVTELGVSCVLYEVPEGLPLSVVMSALNKDRQVAAVQALQHFQVLGGDPVPMASDPYVHLQTGFQALGIAELHRTTTGRGVRIALIDTGVDSSHPDLQGQINYSENMAPEPADHNMADLHGTAVAGVLVARPDNGIGIAGIAPDAKLFAFRACWPSKPQALAANCNSFTLAFALNQALRMGCGIINLSLSGPDDPLLRQLVDKALAQGTLVVAAMPKPSQIGGFPANVKGVIAVGEDDSNHPAIVAPGKDILTTVPQQSYNFMNGSSFAAPHVAGVAALAMQLHPDWRSADILHLLRSSSHNLAAQLPAITAALRLESSR